MKNVKRQFPKVGELAPLLRFTLPQFPTRKNRLAKALTVWDLRLIAKRRTPKGPFDYTDGSAESEVTLERARRSYLDLEFRPNILHDVKNIDTLVTKVVEMAKLAPEDDTACLGDPSQLEKDFVDLIKEATKIKDLNESDTN